MSDKNNINQDDADIIKNLDFLENLDAAESEDLWEMLENMQVLKENTDSDLDLDEGDSNE
ncbi:MAG: hypothetical protein KDD45_04485 [Bdellovibrionales bacterium]|nr:hypothetical protein [Bdellovibrionales bacterium]